MLNIISTVQALQAMDAAAPAVLVTVLHTRGSVPRAAGTRMLITAEQCYDTIGGGHLEWGKLHHLARAGGRDRSLRGAGLVGLQRGEFLGLKAAVAVAVVARELGGGRDGCRDRLRGGARCGAGEEGEDEEAGVHEVGRDVGAARTGGDPPRRKQRTQQPDSWMRRRRHNRAHDRAPVRAKPGGRGGPKAGTNVTPAYAPAWSPEPRRQLAVNSSGCPIALRSAATATL